MQSSLGWRVIAGDNPFANEFAYDFAVATVDFPFRVNPQDMMWIACVSL